MIVNTREFVGALREEFHKELENIMRKYEEVHPGLVGPMRNMMKGLLELSIMNATLAVMQKELDSTQEKGVDNGV